MEQNSEMARLLDLTTDEGVSDEKMLQAITQRVEEMLATDPDLLMSYLYRLDVLEVKINAVLNQPKGLSIPQALAGLIWERQKERLETKKKFKQGPIEGWEY